MKKFSLLFVWFLLCFVTLQAQTDHSAALLVSTEGDPDSFIDHSISVINGDYCEATTDLKIVGPDVLSIERYYNAKNYVTGRHSGGWRIFFKNFLVVGEDLAKKVNVAEEKSVKKLLAFTGERSGGILTYSGNKKRHGIADAILTIDDCQAQAGMVNTFANIINGQTNHKNNQLHYLGDTCEIDLGDGTKRIYKKVEKLPSEICGEEFNPILAEKVENAEFYHLIEEILPSGNCLHYAYDALGHLSSIEMKNVSKAKIISWIRFEYEFKKDQCWVKLSTSDEKTIVYHFHLFSLSDSTKAYALMSVDGSHIIPCSYQYAEINGRLCLIKKLLPENRFVEIEYDAQGRVKTIKEPHSISGDAIVTHSLHYGKDYTDVFDVRGLKTRYHYNAFRQLTQISEYDSQKKLYRSNLKFWGTDQDNMGMLLALAKADGDGQIFSYQAYQYDNQGNVLEECLYGNLSGNGDVAIILDSEGMLTNAGKLECHRITKKYSQDGFNLVVQVGDSSDSQRSFVYKENTNLEIKELIGSKIRKRIFHSYNEDGACVQVIEDDGSTNQVAQLTGVTERHVTNLQPKSTLPGVGLVEVVEERALDIDTNQELLLRKHQNTFDSQGNITCCVTYDSEDHYAYNECKRYDSKGLLLSEVNLLGQESSYSYDAFGNRTSVSIPSQNKIRHYVYDLRNQPIKYREVADDQEIVIEDVFDQSGLKIATIDQYGNKTTYDYDDFGRVIRIIFPCVYDENGQIIYPTIQYSYDIFDNIISTTDHNDFVTQTSYNLRGAPSKVFHPDGSVEWSKYDLGGNLHRSLSRDRVITSYQYDYQGRISKKLNQEYSETKASNKIDFEEFQYNAFGCVGSINDKIATKYQNDPFGRPIGIYQSDSQKKENADTRCNEISYDHLGRVSCKKVWFDHGNQDHSLEYYEYDNTGQILEKRIEDASKNVLLRRTYYYDRGNRFKEEYGFINGKRKLLTRATYDSQGELISSIDALGNETKINIEHGFFNDLGQNVLKKTITNSLGVLTEIEFDAIGRIVKIEKKDPFGVVLSSQRIMYDAGGNKCREINQQIDQGKVIGSQTTYWKYGPMGRLDEQIENYGTAYEKRIRYNYNSLGQMIAQFVSGSDQPVTYSYDRAGRIDSIRHFDSSSEKIAYQYSYDARGNLVKARDQGPVTIFREYDAFDQITREKVVDGHKDIYSVDYLYDRIGRVKSITLPDKSAILYNYNAAFGTEVKRLSSTGKILYSHKFVDYDENGRLLSEAVNDATIFEHQYDDNGRKIAVKAPKWAENGIYDDFGRLTHQSRKCDSASLNTDFTYTKLSQLESEKGTEKNTYSYDSLDNKLKINTVPLVYIGNQLSAYSNMKCVYDPQGNLLRKIIDKDEIRFKYDILSQLVQIDKADKSVVLFYYDPFGRRLAKKHRKGPGSFAQTLSFQRFLHVGDQEIGTIDEKGNVLELRIPGAITDGISSKSIAIEIKGRPYAVIHDLVGNVAALMDPISQNILESYSFSAFGNETIHDSSGSLVAESATGNPWRYSEKRLDKDTGLIFFGFRYYDSQIGRWINPDPLGDWDGPNPYAYIHNNPTNCFDRFGLATESTYTDAFKKYFYGNNDAPPSFFGVSYGVYVGSGEDGSRKYVGNTCNLPKITYNNNFEDHHPPHMRSSQFNLGLPDRPNLRIGFINGIKNSYAEAWGSADYISRLAGGLNVHAVHNMSYGIVTDLLECSMGLKYIATSPVHHLHDMWNDFFKNASPDACFLQVCHSQGAIHVRNALLDYPPELRERILVVAIAPGGYIYRQTCAEVVHYRVSPFRDPVPYRDKKGMLRERKTAISLKSHPNALLHDHGFQSLTYQDALYRRINNYIGSGGREI